MTIVNLKKWWWSSWRITDEWLQQVDVEHRMEAPGGADQGDKPPCHAFSNSVRVVEARSQLARGTTRDGCCRAVMQTKPYPLANVECERPVLLVVVALVVLLSLMKAIADVGEEGISVHQLSVERCHTHRAPIVSTKGRRIAIVDDAEQRILQSHVE